MNKFITLMIALIIAIASMTSAFAEVDLSAMSLDELQQLRSAVNLELASRITDDGALATWDTSMGHIALTGIRTGTTEVGTFGVLCTFSYTNTSDAIDNMGAHHWVKVFQNGVQQEKTAAMLDGETVITSYRTADVQPGCTAENVTWLAQLPEITDTIDIMIEDRSTYPYINAGLFTFSIAQ